jgi:hypothetical protein
MKQADYELVAAALRTARSHNANTLAAIDFNCGVTTAVYRLADAFAAQTTAFDYDLFLKNCGLSRP